ncbi:hypothetical protein [Mesonia aquimarina]|uniref:hypothetical protein n=1 Tax=Mesonia aquimarina TaxID=1504967 RepID=UPI0013CF133A|nr:hypothetical protein [Mesonia aquimarina]
MKKLILICLSIFTLIACEGDRGPQGPPGFDGQNILGSTIEFTADFPLSNEVYFDFFDNGIEVFESDAILVYRSEQTISDPSGPINVWKQLPQTIYFNNGTELAYNFDHTFEDVRIFIEGTTNFDTLNPDEYYNNQLFRIVIVPSDFANDPSINLETYQSLLKEVQKQGFQLDPKTIRVEK